MAALALTREQAAELCNLSVAGFDSWVRRGIVPGPIAGTKRWSRDALQRALSGPEERQDNDNDPEAVFAEWERQHGR